MAKIKKTKKRRLITLYNYFPECGGGGTKPGFISQWFTLDESLLDGNKMLNI